MSVSCNKQIRCMPWFWKLLEWDGVAALFHSDAKPILAWCWDTEIIHTAMYWAYRFVSIHTITQEWYHTERRFMLMIFILLMLSAFACTIVFSTVSIPQHSNEKKKKKKGYMRFSTVFKTLLHALVISGAERSAQWICWWRTLGGNMNVGVRWWERGVMGRVCSLRGCQEVV